MHLLGTSLLIVRLSSWLSLVHREGGAGAARLSVCLSLCLSSLVYPGFNAVAFRVRVDVVYTKQLPPSLSPH